MSSKTPLWQRAAGKNPEGGLSEAGRRSAKAEGHNLKPPAPHPKTEKDAARRKSFCRRMEGAKKKLTSAATANDPDSRINKSLRAWNCADGGEITAPEPKVKKDGGCAEGYAAGGRLDKAPRGKKPIWDKPRPKSLGKSEPLSSSEKSSAKAAAKAAGRPWPNLIDNMRAARKD